MKSHFLARVFLIFLFIFIQKLTISAQDWGIGTQWIYNQVDFFPDGIDEYLRFEIVGEYISKADTNYLIEEKYIAIYPDRRDTVLYSLFNLLKNGDSVFVLKNENQDTSLVYDFSLAVGAEYKMSLHPDFNWDDSNTLALAIDSIGTEDSGAKNLAIQKVKQVDAGADFNLNGNILKGIGWENYFFPVYCCADPPLGGSLFCFENADKTLQVGDCNLLKDTNAVIKDNSIKIYPNPTNGFINIENGFGKTVSVFNVVGQQIKEQVLFDSGINLSDLLSGVYMLLFDNGEIFRVIIL